MLNKATTQKTKTKLKVGDKVQVIAGSDKGKQGKILAIDRIKGRVIVEGVNMLTKHVKPGRKRDYQQGGLIHQEGYIHQSNVMYLLNGKPTRLGYQLPDESKSDSKKIKSRIAKSTGDAISE